MKYLLLLALTGCAVEPLAKSVAENGFTVELLGYVEGCRVYSLDRGRAYTAICGRLPSVESTTTTEIHTESCGKNCVRTVRTPTIIGKQP